MAYSVAVIEHVPSPSAFLKAIRGRLRDAGTLVLVQPTQDVPSYDVFFVDHLHHFGTAHVERLARMAGFRQVSCEVGHPLMPNFSLHVFEASDPDAGAASEGFRATTCEQTVREIIARMELLDGKLARYGAEGRRVAVFGLNEVYWLARAYSRLGTFPIACGFDDTPDKPEYARLGFPVVRPEDGVSEGIDTVVLAMNTMYYPIALPRLERLGYDVHTVLE
jgi:hypothetical protein